MFQGLESHSVLHVLHKSINLALLPEKEVFDLLKKRPVFTLLEDGESLSPCESRPSFFEDKESELDEEEKGLSTEEELAKDSKLHPEVARDIILYHSFCALRHFMASITYTVEEYAQNDNERNKCEATDETPGPDNVVGKQSSNTTNLGASQPEDRRIDMQDIKEMLEAGKNHLSHVYPLTYRVEVLENMFSLLFATYEDLSDGRTPHNESDDFETNDEETRSLKSSLTGSMESLASTDLSLDYSPLKEQDGVSSPTFEAVQRQRDQHATPVETLRRRQLFRSDVMQSDLNDTERKAPASLQNKGGPSFLRKGKSGKAKQDQASDGNLPRASVRSSEEEISEEPRVGFVANDSVVPEFLKTLKDCLMELNTAKFSEHKKGE